MNYKFSDIAVYEQEKSELKRLCDIINNRELYLNRGAKLRISTVRMHALGKENFRPGGSANRCCVLQEHRGHSIISVVFIMLRNAMQMPARLGSVRFETSLLHPLIAILRLDIMIISVKRSRRVRALNGRMISCRKATGSFMNLRSYTRA